MGLYDRDYTQEHYQSDFRNAPQMRMGMPSLTPVVKWLLIINTVIFLLSLSVPVHDFFEKWFSVWPDSPGAMLQVWRLVTYQFLHANIGHIFFNMLGLFFLGPVLEQNYGSRRFLVFYLGCGIAGGIFYTLLTAAHFPDVGPMVGASGAILGMLAACAILFPHFVVFILVFPVPIRIAAIGFTAVYLVNVLTAGANAGGDAAHLAGMAAGAAYVFSQPLRNMFRLKIKARRWNKNVAAERNLQFEVDRILEKVHQSGIHSLTRKEKTILRKATELEQLRNKL